MLTALCTGVHVPFPVVVSVRFNDPLAISAGVGLYNALREFALGVYVPAPPLHCPPPAIVTDPSNDTCAWLEHTEIGLPAFAVGAGVNVIVISSETALHPSFPVVVSVKVIDPELISVVVGEYVVLSKFALGAYVPNPPLQVAPVANVMVPLKSISALLEQTILFSPASTVGASVNVNTTSSVTGLHVPFAVVVRFSVIDPFEISLGVGV